MRHTQHVIGSIRPSTFCLGSFLQGIGELEQAGVLQGETLVKLLCNRAACQLQLSKPLPALGDSQRAVMVSCCLAARCTLKVQLQSCIRPASWGCCQCCHPAHLVRQDVLLPVPATYQPGNPEGRDLRCLLQTGAGNTQASLPHFPA